MVIQVSALLASWFGLVIETTAFICGVRAIITCPSHPFSLLLNKKDPTNTSAFNNHGYGITPEDFDTFPDLAETFTVLR